MSKKEAKAAPDFFSSLPPGFLDNPLTQSMRASAQQIWAAGLGAFSKGGEGSKLFEQLVSEGLKLQQRTQEMAMDKFGSSGAEFGQKIGDKARKQWSQLESIFEHRVEQALTSMGMPTATEVRELREQLDALGAEVAALKATKAPAAAKTAPAKKVAPRKAPTKKTAAKKLAA
ncbi:phasin family protein [Burkholderiaceae bacterium UC74_6]